MKKYFAYIKPEPVISAEIVDLFGLSPHSYHDAEFVIIKSQEDYQPVLNLKVESECSPTFKQAVVRAYQVLIGYGDRVILFDFLDKKIMFSMILEGYFSEFTFTNDAIYIASEAKIICLDWQGEQKWVSADLGIDGVRIHSVAEGKITGSGEWDPPGGWRAFELEQTTGKPFNNAR